MTVFTSWREIVGDQVDLIAHYGGWETVDRLDTLQELLAPERCGDNFMTLREWLHDAVDLGLLTYGEIQGALSALAKVL